MEERELSSSLSVLKDATEEESEEEREASDRAATSSRVMASS